ncbi:hypothetical protein E2542_SST11058 [Spatholobus suberectus]|nr:hypothetical protein E2542_SST11058 [Spatholobus suberectus]
MRRLNQEEEDQHCLCGCKEAKGEVSVADSKDALQNQQQEDGSLPFYIINYMPTRSFMGENRGTLSLWEGKGENLGSKTMSEVSANKTSD